MESASIISGNDHNADLYKIKSARLKVEASRINSAAENAEDKARNIRREENRLDSGPAAKISISKEARELANKLNLGNNF